jgi:hypothetical protein
MANKMSNNESPSYKWPPRKVQPRLAFPPLLLFQELIPNESLPSNLGREKEYPSFEERVATIQLGVEGLAFTFPLTKLILQRCHGSSWRLYRDGNLRMNMIVFA